jgi:hypothetical protein
MQHALALMAEMEARGSISAPGCDDPRLGLDYLFGPARGQMFGVLACQDVRGNGQVLKAFSGQYNGVWEVPGWVPPIVDPAQFHRTIRDDEPRIKALTRLIGELPPESPRRSDLSAERRQLSAGLMERIFDLYRLANFRGQRRLLREAFLGRAMPTGTGECCAPKLLHHAALNGLIPLALAEFYVGRENRSGTRTQGRFFAPCAEKCRPILGFILCGSEELRSGSPIP